MKLHERMLSSHIAALTANYDEKQLEAFSKPKLEADTVTSLDEKNKIAHITRHLLTGEATHSLILKDEFYERV